MKIKTILILAILSINSAYASVDQIRTELKVLKNGKAVHSSGTNVLSGTPGRMAVTEDPQKGESGSPPVGLILESKTNSKNGKIRYSCLFTIRVRSDSQSEPDQSAFIYKTTEFYLSGLTEPGKEIKAELEDGWTVTLVFTKKTIATE